MEGTILYNSSAEYDRCYVLTLLGDAKGFIESLRTKMTLTPIPGTSNGVYCNEIECKALLFPRARAAGLLVKRG